MKKFLGWDCANRTLAWSYVCIDTHIYSKLSILVDELCTLFDIYMGDGFSVRMLKFNSLNPTEQEMFRETLQDPEFIEQFLFILDAMYYFSSQFIQYISSGVADILQGKKVNETSEIERTEALWRFLINHKQIACIDGKPIIEHQPPKIGSKTNNKSTAVSQQLAFYYIEHSPVFIDPKLKNNIALSEDLTFALYLAEEIPKHKSLKDARYSARKLHSKESFLYLIKVFDLEHVIDDVPRAVLDDLADSTMQILAYLVENKLFV